MEYLKFFIGIFCFFIILGVVVCSNTEVERDIKFDDIVFASFILSILSTGLKWGLF